MRRGSPEAGQWCSSLGEDGFLRTWSLKLAGAAGASCSGALFCVSIKQAFPELFGLWGQRRGQDQAMFSGLLRGGGAEVVQCCRSNSACRDQMGQDCIEDPCGLLTLALNLLVHHVLSLSSVTMQPGGRESSLVSPHVQSLCRVWAFYLQDTPRASMSSPWHLSHPGRCLLPWVLFCLPSASFCPVFVHRLGLRACIP